MKKFSGALLFARNISFRPDTNVTTVFGATGFIGPYIVQQIGAGGNPVLVPTRNLNNTERKFRYLRVMGDLGQVLPLQFDARNEDSVKYALERSSNVVNVIGKPYASKGFSVMEANRDIPATFARLAKEAGVQNFVHISCLGAREDSPSSYLRAKYAGERAVLDAFPEATILRCSRVFGLEDNLLNFYAEQLRSYMLTPIINGGTNRIQPVYVGDVAKAVTAALSKPEARGKVYEIAGPETITIKELCDKIAEHIETTHKTFPVPIEAVQLLARFLEKLPSPPLTQDQLVEFQEDIVASPNALTIQDLGVTPSKIDDHAALILRRFQKASHIFIKAA